MDLAWVSSILPRGCVALAKQLPVLQPEAGRQAGSQLRAPGFHGKAPPQSSFNIC